MSYPMIKAFIELDKDSINFKPRLDLSINNTDVESISMELLCNKNQNTLINALHRPVKGFAEPFVKT